MYQYRTKSPKNAPSAGGCHQNENLLSTSYCQEKDTGEDSQATAL